MEGNDNTPANFSLDFLVKLIPNDFNGDRYKVRSFIKQVDSVWEIAVPSQHPALLLYTKSKITGKAREQIDIHCDLQTWEEISALLLRLYQDKKSMDQLLEELNSIRQGNNESVSQFYQRLEDLASRILGIVHATEPNEAQLKGRLLMVNEMTLNRFIYHTHPQVSQMLRYREFKQINEAFTAALAEEKALRLNSRNNNQSKCAICGKNHPTQSCYRNKQNTQQTRQVNFSTPSGSQPQPASNTSNASNVNQCRYCKKFGHTIEQCRKRQFNNSKNNNNQNNNNNQGSSNSNTNTNNNNNYKQNYRPKNNETKSVNHFLASPPADGTPPTPIQDISETLGNFNI